MKTFNHGSLAIARLNPGKITNRLNILQQENVINADRYASKYEDT